MSKNELYQARTSNDEVLFWEILIRKAPVVEEKATKSQCPELCAQHLERFRFCTRGYCLYSVHQIVFANMMTNVLAFSGHLAASRRGPLREWLQSLLCVPMTPKQSHCHACDEYDEHFAIKLIAYVSPWAHVSTKGTSVISYRSSVLEAEAVQ